MMSVETTAAQIVNKRNGLWGLAESWLEPRSKDRDEAFRERVIRSSVGIVILLVLLSFASSIFVFQSVWAWISFPTLHLVGLVGLSLSAVFVSRGKVLAAGWLLILTVVLCAGVYLLLARQENSIIGVLDAVPVLMFAPLLAAMVLPRNLILPISVLSTATYAVSQFVIPVPGLELPGLTAGPQIISVFLLVLIEGTLLRQLRVEFDARLNAMSLSIQQAERAQKQAEDARLEAENDRRRAEESDKAKSQFLANMSHELRTPLNAIIGYDEAMLGGLAGEFSPQQTKLLGHIQFNSRRLLGLINDILDLSKIESGSLQVFLAPMSPRKVIEDVVDNLRSLADQKKIDLKVQFSESVPEVVLGDSNKLQQILTNLLSNAIKFTERGGVTVDVGVVDTSHWQFQVRDTGIGMPPNAASYIFEPFQQVDNTDQRKYKGTGLGLAITNRLVNSLNGTIAVDTKLGQGTTFSVKLPRTHIPGEPTEQSAEPEQAHTVETKT